MRYSIDEAKALFQRWKDSASITRIVFADVATGGSVTGLIKSVIEPAEPSEIKLAVDFEILLPNGIPGSSLVDIRFWGTEEVEFTDFTDEPPSMQVPDDLERFNCCIAIQYELGSMLSVCEVWPSPALETWRGTTVDISQFEDFLNEHKNEI